MRRAASFNTCGMFGLLLGWEHLNAQLESFKMFQVLSFADFARHISKRKRQ